MSGRGWIAAPRENAGARRSFDRLRDKYRDCPDKPSRFGSDVFVVGGSVRAVGRRSRTASVAGVMVLFMKQRRWWSQADIARTLETELRKRGGGDGLGDAVRVATQMIYGFLLLGILNPRAPTQANAREAVGVD